jgi:formylglycine-generating enzyme required for sulfatase activity
VAQSRFVPGQHVGPYRLIKFLAAGTYSEVWLAERASNLMARQAALKLPFDPDIDLVRREAQTWKRASGHPNVLPVWDADIDANGQVYIASEYVDGGTLTGWLAWNGGKAPSLEAAVRMTVDILKGLEHLHTITPHPVIHRDLKPDNILLQGGIPRLTDFGIARVLRSTNFTQRISGTPPYMAPEVFSGKYSEQSDLWAVGVIFYRLLTGNLPFPQSDLNALIGTIVMGKPDTLPPSFASNIRPIFETVFQKDPAARYTSAQAMRQDVEALLYAPQPEPALTLQPQLPPSPAPQLFPAPQVAAVETTRRGFIMGMAATGLTLGGLYALNVYKQAKVREQQANSVGAKPPTSGSQARIGDGTKTKPTPLDGAAMVWIPPGAFQMGGKGRDETIHEVKLSGFWMYKTPVTVAQFRKYCDSGQFNRDFGKDYYWNDNQPPNNYPMVNVSWTEAAAYAKWAGVVLPTEVQWEYAARGGLVGKNYPWGDDWDGAKCANSVKPNHLIGTKPVASYAANGYGLYDMAGNVWQWCVDWYAKDYYGTEAAKGPAPTDSATDSLRVCRGGSWYDGSEDDFRCARRFACKPGSGGYFIGFRCCALG